MTQVAWGQEIVRDVEGAFWQAIEGYRGQNNGSDPTSRDLRKIERNIAGWAGVRYGIRPVVNSSRRGGVLSVTVRFVDEVDGLNTTYVGPWWPVDHMHTPELATWPSILPAKT